MKQRAAIPDFIVVAEIYNANVGVFRKLAELKRWCQSKHLPFDESITEENTNACAGHRIAPNGVGWSYAFIPKSCPAYRVCHECLHLAWFILDSHGVEVTADNHESLAYLQQHLAKQILRHK